MQFEHFADYDDLSDRAAALLLGAVRRDPRIVLGLPTGRTPIGMYGRVVANCKREYHCFRDVVTFNLDEYARIPSDHPGSYCTYMRQHLFDHVDLEPARTYIPNGMASDLEAECARYEIAIRDAGGLGLTFLGLGRNGHIGFNEPGTSFASRTRLVSLAESTREANASLFPDGDVPRQAITIGIATILESRSIVLLVSGKEKAEAVARLRQGEPSEQFPASALWKHDDVLVLVA